MEFFLRINIKMPTTVGILIFMSTKNSILGLSESKNAEFMGFFLYLRAFKIQSLVYYLKNLDTNYSFLYLLSLIMCERVEKIIARTLCFMHQRIFRPIYIFNNYAYFLDFRAQKYPLIFLNLNPFYHQQALHFGV